MGACLPVAASAAAFEMPLKPETRRWSKGRNRNNPPPRYRIIRSLQSTIRIDVICWFIIERGRKEEVALSDREGEGSAGR